MGRLMNSTTLRLPCGCKAILNEKDPRAEIWRKVFGCLEFPLKSPVPIIGQAQGEPSDRFLMGDWEALDLGQQQRLIEEMKKHFPIDDQAFRKQNEVFGYIPIKDQNITVVVCKLHTMMMQ